MNLQFILRAGQLSSPLSLRRSTINYINRVNCPVSRLPVQRYEITHRPLLQRRKNTRKFDEFVRCVGVRDEMEKCEARVVNERTT